MDWNRWLYLDDNIRAMSFTNKNWTQPFLKNVLYCLNSSVNNYDRSYKVSNYENGALNFVFQAAEYGFITSFLLIILIQNIIHKNDASNFKNAFTLRWPSFVNLQTFLTIASFIIFAFILPISLLMLCPFFVYKRLIDLYLKTKHRKNYVAMMDCTDVVWALEEENAKSIINVIGIVEPKLSINDEKNLVNDLRMKVSSKLLGPDSVCPKMFYKRCSYLGYHFWMYNHHININDYIKPMETGNITELTNEDLQDYIQSMVNYDLPKDASWEILVSNIPMKNTEHFPILFRLHHSLGDGVALLRLLLNTIGTFDPPKKVYKRQCSRYELVKNWFTVFFSDLNLAKLTLLIEQCMLSAIKMAKIMYKVPVTLVNQVLRPPDNNILHGPILDGGKIVAWSTDEQCKKGVISTIRQLKKKIPGASFSDLILTALSMSFQKYFHEKRHLVPVPDIITAVVPIRMNSTNFDAIGNNECSVKLENRFSVAMLTIPIQNDGMTSSDTSIIKRLVAVQNETAKLRKSADFYVNYCVMTMGGYVLPDFILKPMISSVQASLVLSNLPGPSNVIICDKYKLKDMAFFIPNRGTTGVGVTIISCNDKINLGITADSILLDNRKDAQFILENTLKELERIDAFVSKCM